MPGSIVRLIGNTFMGLLVLSFTLPWLVTQRWPDQAGLTGASNPQVLVASQAGGIPPRVLQSLLEASKIDCHMPWYVLAGISKVESDHAWGGKLDAAGNVIDAQNTAGPEISWLDERAWGPMQFLPSSWKIFGQGGNINNIDDSTKAAARHLCSGASGKTDPASIRQGVLSYNHSEAYADDVLAYASQYRASAPAPVAGGERRSVFGAISSFYGLQQQRLSERQMPIMGSMAGKLGNFWGWVGQTSPDPAPGAVLPPSKGNPDPQCPGRSLTPDGRFQAPPGTTTPEQTAQVARALRARFGVSSSMLRSVVDRNASDGAATCSDHLWGGGLDTDGSVIAWVTPWQDKLFRFITDDYADGHAHLSMNENVDTQILAQFIASTCAGYDCAAQRDWDPPAQFSHYGEGSLGTLSL